MPHKMSFPLLVWWFKNKNITHFSLYQSQRDGIFDNQVLQCASRTICLQGPSREELSTRCCKAPRVVTATLSWISVPLYLAYTHSSNQVEGTTALHVAALSANTIFHIQYVFFSSLYLLGRLALCRQHRADKSEKAAVLYWQTLLPQMWTWSTLYPSQLKMQVLFRVRLFLHM